VAEHAHPDPIASKLEIQEVIFLRARAADRRDVELARRCYHPGATEDHEGFKGTAEAFLAQSQIQDTAKVPVMSHAVSNILIELHGDVAAVESYVTVHAEIVGERVLDVTVVGRYLDRFAYRDGRWAIEHRQLVFDTSRVEAASPRYWEAFGLDPDTLHFGAVGSDDPLHALLRSVSPRS